MTTLRHRLEDAAVGWAGSIVHRLPMRVVRACGAGLGRVAYVVDRRHRRTAIENLAHAFPDLTPDAHRRLARASFAHFGSLLLELLEFERLTPEQMLQRVECEGEDRARDALRRGRGVLFFTGHFGYWEMQAIVHALRMPPVAVLARPLDNPGLHARLERIRTRTGNRVIYRQGAVRQVMRQLSQNGSVALLIDQHLLTGAVPVTFFDRDAATTTALATLALRTGAAVIPVFALPLPGGRYRFIYERPVEPPDAACPDAVREFTQRCTGVLESYVRRHPELWLWMHRRWRDDGQTEPRGAVVREGSASA